MAFPTRNGPCPCGSGKKYKACCLDKDEAERRGAHDHGHTHEHAPENGSELDRTMALRSKLIEDLMEFAERSHQRVLKQGRNAFHRLDDFGDEGEEVAPLDEQEELDWTERWMNAVMFDLPANRESESVGEAYLRRQSGKLAVGERAWLEAMVNAPLTPYEVGDVQAGVGFTVGSLSSGGEVFLAEPLASEDLVSGDLLAARVTTLDGKSMIEGGSYTYPPGMKGAIEAEVRKYAEENGARAFEDLDLAHRRLFSIVLHAIWNELILHGEAPAEGSEEPTH